MLRSRSRNLFAVVAAGAAALLIVSLAVAGSTAAKVTINVTAKDYSFTLSKKNAPAGQVTFSVKNSGKKDHSFQIAGKKTAVIKPGKTAKLVVTFKKAGPFPYVSAVAGDAKKGMKGIFTVKAAAAPAPSGNVAAGKTVFTNTGCGACHVMKEAGTTGTVGPNLDTSGASLALIVDRVTNGKGTMQAYASVLTAKQIQDVAAFVFASKG
jgi:mono/diheme cytochrome c family protein